MKKKWNNINELIEKIAADDMMDNCRGCFTGEATYAPNIGYRAWIMKYKGTPVCLWDMGNGHYSFHSAVSWIDILVAKIQCMCIKSLRSGL